MRSRRATGARSKPEQLAGDRLFLVVRQVFETWWIGVSVGFDETWVADGGYWHAWDRHRSVSLSSTILTEDDGRPAPASEIMDSCRALILGEPIEATPPGLLAQAAIIRTDPPSPASRALSGFVAVEGRVLLATITSDDIGWATRIWESIGYRPAPIRARAAGAGRLA